MHLPEFWLVEKFVSFLDETKKIKPILLFFFEAHFEISKLGSFIQTFTRSLPVSPQKVRKAVFAEFTAFQRFVKADKYAKILVLSTIFSTLVEKRIIWLFFWQISY